MANDFGLFAALGGAVATLAAGAYIVFQSSQITGLRAEKVLLVEKVGKLEAAITLSITERVRIADQLKEYQNRKAEVEVRYITKPTTVFKEVIKTVPPETVSTKANEETNALFDSINSSAVTFSLRNDKN
jgi:hypothetical protein